VRFADLLGRLDGLSREGDQIRRLPLQLEIVTRTEARRINHRVDQPIHRAG